MGSRLGTLKISAKRIGVPFEQYLVLVNSGQKFCWKCATWKTFSQFGIDKSRYDGLASACLTCRRPRTGRPKLINILPLERQARNAVNDAIRKGRMVKASNLLCFDCGCQAREYDHCNGYERENWFTVQAVCSSCHKKRTYSR